MSSRDSTTSGTAETRAKSSAVLLLTHFWDPVVASFYRLLAANLPIGHDLYLLYDDTKSDFDKFAEVEGVRGYPFRWEQLYSLGYPVEYYGKRDLHWIGHMNFASTKFWLDNPDYDYVWTIEHDVRYTGSWMQFFSAFADNMADLLGTTLVRYEEVPDWYWFDSLRSPAWFFRKRQMIRSFLPIYRLSAAALNTLDKRMRQGWCGHFEVMIPTVLHYYGLRIEDVGGVGEFTPDKRRNLMYTNDPKSAALDSGTLRFRPIMAEPGERPDTLWHPVKTQLDRREKRPLVSGIEDAETVSEPFGLECDKVHE